MTQLLRHPQSPDAAGRSHAITPATAGWDYIGFEVYQLAPGQSVTGQNEGCEICAVLLSGAVSLWVDGTCLRKGVQRLSPFAAEPAALYAPLGADWQVQALESSEIAICRAPAKRRLSPFVIAPGDVAVETRGSGANIRHVRDLLPDSKEQADSLLVVEAITPSGNWSSYPPHKHDQDNLPHELQLEEVYYHRFNPPQGFAFQRVYTDSRDLDETMTVEDRDLVLVPRGYHPVSAPHGYDLYYLNVMAGPRRIWKTQPDPAHAWLSQIGPAG